MSETMICAVNGAYHTDISPEQAQELRAQPNSVFWLDINDPLDHDYARLVEWFNTHPLTIEDMRHGGGRPKIELHEDHYFIIFYAVSRGTGDDRFDTQPIYILAGHNFFVTVHTGALVQVEETMRRWRDPNIPPTDRVGSLLYALLDTVVDDYFPLLDGVADEAEQIEDQIFAQFERSSIQTIFELKRDLLALRRVIAPERDVINSLMRREIPLFRGKDMMYLQDVYDHILRITDGIDSYRDLLSSALDSYLSVEASRQNQVLKVLTVTSIILMTNALIAGIYGMNFEFMPELHWQYGYAYALGLMVVCSVGLILFFKRLKWI